MLSPVRIITEITQALLEKLERIKNYFALFEKLEFTKNEREYGRYREAVPVCVQYVLYVATCIRNISFSSTFSSKKYCQRALFFRFEKTLDTKASKLQAVIFLIWRLYCFFPSHSFLAGLFDAGGREYGISPFLPFFSPRRKTNTESKQKLQILQNAKCLPGPSRPTETSKKL